MPVTGSSSLGRGNKKVGGNFYVGGDLVVTGDVKDGASSGAFNTSPRIARVALGARTTGEKTTALVLPTKGLVMNVWVDITTLEATATTKTIDVGLLSSESGGDADGFLKGVSTATPAAVRQGAFTAVDGASQNYFTTTYGVLLYEGDVGGDAAGTAAAVQKRWHVLNGTAKTISYTLGSAHTEVVGYIYVAYVDLTA